MGTVLPHEEQPGDEPVVMVFRDGCYVPAGPNNSRHGMPSASVFRVSNPPDIHRVGPPVVNPASLRPKLLSAVASGEGLCIEGMVDTAEPGVVSLYRQFVPKLEHGEQPAEGEAEPPGPDDAFERWWRAERDGFPAQHNPARREWIGYADFARGKDQRFSIGPIVVEEEIPSSPGRQYRVGPPDADGEWRLVLVVSSGRECERVTNYLKEAQSARRASASSVLGAGLGLDLEHRVVVPESQDELPVDVEEHTCFRVRRDPVVDWDVWTLKQCVRVNDDMFEAEGVMYGQLGTRRMPSGWRRSGSASYYGTCGLDTPRSMSGTSQQEEEEPGQSTCVICMLEPRDTALLPCRHLCMCSSCADVVRLRSQACPICRQSIQSLISIDAPIEVSG